MPGTRQMLFDKTVSAPTGDVLGVVASRPGSGGRSNSAVGALGQEGGGGGGRRCRGRCTRPMGAPAKLVWLWCLRQEGRTAGKMHQEGP